MKVVVQRVLEASVSVEEKVVGEIKHGLLVYLGIHTNDTAAILELMVKKLLTLRLFEDVHGKMNDSVHDVKGEILVISQFTLYANCNRGRRPDFLEAAPPAMANLLYNQFIEEIKKELGHVQSGCFGAHMKVSSVNDGPVTLIIEK